jgi:hypothetical protein
LTSNKEYLEVKEWFAKELSELKFSPIVTVALYITRSASTTYTTSDQGNREMIISQSPSLYRRDPEKADIEKSDPEKHATIYSKPSPTLESNITEVIGRPDIDVKVGNIVAGMGAHERAIVAACGPAGLMAKTRRVVAALVSTQDKSLTLHCERFGW